MNTVTYTVPNISCHHCVHTIQTELGELAGVQSVQAVQSALNKVSTEILDRHLNSCLITAVRGDDPAERERVLREITDVFEAASKV